jgi:hypothetical protein
LVWNTESNIIVVEILAASLLPDPSVRLLGDLADPNLTTPVLRLLGDNMQVQLLEAT